MNSGKKSVIQKTKKWSLHFTQTPTDLHLNTTRQRNAQKFLEFGSIFAETEGLGYRKSATHARQLLMSEYTKLSPKIRPHKSHRKSTWQHYEKITQRQQPWR